MSYQFSVIVNTTPKDHNEILAVADAFGEAGCLDASIGGHDEGVEVIFNRDAPSLDAAIKSAITAIESAGFPVKRVEMTRESIVVEA